MRTLWKYDEKSDFYYLSDDEKDLECDDCGDQSIMHACTAYYHERYDRLLCPMCYKKVRLMHKKSYISIETNKKELCQYGKMMRDMGVEIVYLNK